ncbi:MAG: complex I subunit 1/NuoH family protein [bacterium]
MIDIAIIAARAAAAWMLPLSLIPLLIWFERKGAAFIQDRTGPNRAAILGVRLGGIVHNFADVVKLITKEDIVPAHVNRFLFVLAPMVAMSVALLTVAVIPLADTLAIFGREIPMQAAPLNAGILYLLAISSFGVYAVVLAGWASNNAYSLLGGIRASAQMISYELTIGLSIVGIIMIFGSFDMNTIVRGQSGEILGILPKWGIFLQPVGFLLFLVSAFAETNRNPFDLPEGESEIIGYHVEYSSMKFALFFMAEYAHMVVASAVTATLFLGGWQVPYFTTQELKDHAGVLVPASCALAAVAGIGILILSRRYSRTLHREYRDLRSREGDVFTVAAALLILAGGAGFAVTISSTLPDWAPPVFAVLAQIGSFSVKLLVLTFLFVWVRWTLPRFRYDQLMALGWKGMIPLAFANVLVTAVAILLIDGNR